MKACLLVLLACVPAAEAADLPIVTVERDNTVIDRSCRVVIPPDTVIADEDGNGVIQVRASDIVIEFASGSVLRGAGPELRPDQYRGFGIRIVGQKNVTVRGARLQGYLAGLYATEADGLVLEDIEARDIHRQHLKSTPAAEDGSDWLWPHANEQNEWLTRYGAALYVEESDGVTVRRCRVRESQNGLGLDGVNDSKIYDNDFSFLSGWGVCMWRCNRNVISRNAVDFCVRGYSHGVYNRGQDSAGFLVFEQNNDNVFAENSATHGGDCFFGFAGREALGEVGEHPAAWYRRRGNNNNLLIKNDFSYAPAHGIEMTFSFGNRFLANRLVGNAICGVWGGYSQDTLIAGNTFENNGEMGYGLERGGVNIEHGRGNRILHNTFVGNRCGVHLWWDEEGDFAEKPWGAANGTASTDNLIAANVFERNELVFHFRGPSDVTLGGNELRDNKRELEAEDAVTIKRKPDLRVPPLVLPDYPVYGETRPVGARPHLRGRENIIMTEWGPWDHESPLVRLVETVAGRVTYDLHKMPGRVAARLDGKGLRGELLTPAEKNQPTRYVVHAPAAGVYPYRVHFRAGDFETTVSGTLVAVNWQATFFKWDAPTDPRENLAGWRSLAESPEALTVETDRLVFKYGFGGPGELGLSDELKQAGLGGDHFGMIARARLPLPAGRWRFVTTSDDGVRVLVDGRPVVEDWTWHAPKRNEGVFELKADRTVEVVVEHFEIDGFAVLEFDLQRSE